MKTKEERLIEHKLYGELFPDFQTLIKIGSIVNHTKEMLSDKGHTFDVITIKQLINDDDVNEWIKIMDDMALLPKLR